MARRRNGLESDPFWAELAIMQADGSVISRAALMAQMQAEGTSERCIGLYFMGMRRTYDQHQASEGKEGLAVGGTASAILSRTPEEREANIRYLASLKLRELRKRQDLTAMQIGMAEAQGREESVAALQEMELDLAAAVELRAFA